jgi:hypothetical protein
VEEERGKGLSRRGCVSPRPATLRSPSRRRGAFSAAASTRVLVMYSASKPFLVHRPAKGDFSNVAFDSPAMSCQRLILSPFCELAAILRVLMIVDTELDVLRELLVESLVVRLIRRQLLEHHDRLLHNVRASHAIFGVYDSLQECQPLRGKPLTRFTYSLMFFSLDVSNMSNGTRFGQ